MEIDCTHLDLLRPDKMQFFWLRWYDDYISFGYGSVVDVNEITGFGEPLPDLKAVALYGYQHDVKYEVRNIVGKGYIFLLILRCKLQIKQVYDNRELAWCGEINVFPKLTKFNALEIIHWE